MSPGRIFQILAAAYLFQAIAAAPFSSLPAAEDSIIPEETYTQYDAETEGKLGAEKQANDNIIASRISNEADLMKQVNNLLNDLETHIDDEKISATTQADGERTTNTQDNKDELDAAKNEFDAAMKILTDAVTDTTKANDVARAEHETAEKELASASNEKTASDNQVAQAKASSDNGSKDAIATEETCHTAADTAEKRILDAIDKQLKLDLEWLDDGRTIVKDVTDMMTKVVSGNGAGTGSRFPTLAQTMSMLSVNQRLKIKQLMNSKYVAEDRASKSTDNIFMVMKIISKSIDDEQKAVEAKAKSDKVAASTTATKEKTECTDRMTSHVEFLQDLVKTSAVRQGAADTQLQKSTDLEDGKREVFDQTDAAQKTAEDNLATQTPVLEGAHRTRTEDEATRFKTETDRIDDKLEKAHEYLTSEASTVNNIRLIISGIGSTKTTGDQLLQMANRMVAHANQHYVSDLSAHSGIRDKIDTILADTTKKANDDKGAADARAKGLNAQNMALRKKLEGESQGRLTKVTTDQQALVDTADSENAAKQDTLNKAVVASTSALAKKDAQATVLQAATDEQARVLPILAKEKAGSEDAADTSFTRDTGFATSKRDQSLKYVNEEWDVVAEIREALKGLNKPVDQLLQDPTVSASQHAFIQQLVHMAGKYDNEARAGYAGSAHTQKERIEDLLQGIEKTISDEKGKIGATFDADSKEIQGDKDEAYLTAKNKHDVGVKAQEDAVAKEQKQFGSLAGEHTSRVAEQTGAQNEFDTTTANLAAAKQTQETEVTIATTQHNSDMQQAGTYYTERATTIRQETNSEKARLDDTISAVGKMSALVESMTFVSGNLLQYNEDRKTYRATDTSSTVSKVLTLIDSLTEHCNEEEGRCDSEFLRDEQANNDEKTARDNEAKALKAKQTQDLQDAVDKARDESKASNDALVKATTEHLDISETHNANIDTRSTAAKIQELNIPTFQADFDRTKALADDVFDEEREIIDGKAESSKFYLNQESKHLKTIVSMLSQVNLLSATNTHDIGESGYSARPDFSIENNAKNWEDRHTDDYKRERSAGENTETVDVDAEDHALTANRGESTTYDANGEENGEESLVQENSEDIGSALKRIASWVESEYSHVVDQHGKETDAASTRRDKLIANADNILKTLNAKDAARLTDAEDAEKLSGEKLMQASATKDVAQKDADAKAATLRDALATQSKYVPKVEDMAKTSLNENVQAHDQASENIKNKRHECKTYITEELSLLTAIRTKVEAKLGLTGEESQDLVQQAMKALARTHAKTKYAFTVDKAKAYDDQQKGEYMNSGPAEEYTTGVTNLRDFIRNIRTKDKALLVEIEEKYNTEKTEFDDERKKTIADSETLLKDTLDKLQGEVDSAKSERDTAENARAAQEKVRIAAESDHGAKDTAHKEAVKLETKEVGEGLTLSNDEIADANSAYDDETGQYTSLLKSQNTLLTKEQSLLDKIMEAMEGEGFSLKSKPKHIRVDYCAAEKDAMQKAETDYQAKAQECAAHRVNQAGGADAVKIERKSKACLEETKAFNRKKLAGLKYQHCISKPASLVSVHEAKTALVQLGTKYIGKDFDYEAAKQMLGGQIGSIRAKIESEATAAQQQYDADMKSSEQKRDTEIARSQKVLADLTQQHKEAVATAEGLRQNAQTVMVTEQGKYSADVAVKNEKQGLYEGALNTQKNDGDQARKDNDETIKNANQRYDDNERRITNILNEDKDYLNEELATVDTVEKIINGLGIDDEIVTKLV
jgi:hypothetical protein